MPGAGGFLIFRGRRRAVFSFGRCRRMRGGGGGAWPCSCRRLRHVTARMVAGRAASRTGLAGAARRVWRPWAGLGRRCSAPASALPREAAAHAATAGQRRGLPLRSLPAPGAVRGSPCPPLRTAPACGAAPAKWQNGAPCCLLEQRRCYVCEWSGAVPGCRAFRRTLGLSCFVISSNVTCSAWVGDGGVHGGGEQCPSCSQSRVHATVGGSKRSH